jgi:hypothetical protein
LKLKHLRPQREKINDQGQDLIKLVVKGLDSSSSSASASANCVKAAFFTQAGFALAVYCKSQEHQQDITFLSMMTSP